MHIRKLVKAGQASHTISLPKNWLDKNNLRKGDTVYLHEKSDKELLVTPNVKEDAINDERKEINISVDKKTLDTIHREITSAYINNFGTINIIGESLPEYAKSIREILHDFIALEISEQTTKRVVAKDLLNLEDVSVDKTLKRMDMIVRSMFQDCLTSGDHPEIDESLHFRDEDVNKIYFLLFRLLKMSLKDPKMAEKFGLSNDKILSTWYLNLNIENVADCCKNISNSLKKASKENANKIVEVFKEVETDYLDVMKSYYNKDKTSADNIAKKRVDVIKKLDNVPKDFVENLKLMVTFVNNIARIVIDE